MANDKGLNRGGTMGQEGEIGEDSGRDRQAREELEKRDQQKQRGGIGREPSLEDKQREDKKKIQPTHVVD